MSNVIHFPKRPVRQISGPIVLSTDDLRFQQAIREQSAELRARRQRAQPNFERFWSQHGGIADCGDPTGGPDFAKR